MKAIQYGAVASGTEYALMIGGDGENVYITLVGPSAQLDTSDPTYDYLVEGGTPAKQVVRIHKASGVADIIDTV